MPLFEYQCDDCGHLFEELVSRADERMICPSCKSDKVKKLISTFAASAGSSGSETPCGAPSCNSGFS